MKQLLPGFLKKYRAHGPSAFPQWVQIWSACWWSARDRWRAPFVALLRIVRFYIRPYGAIIYWHQLPPYDSVEFKLNAALGYQQIDGYDMGGVERELAHVARSHETERELILPQGLPRMLNQTCDDIGKHAISRIFADVFGYDLEINPTEYEGWIACKSNTNAKHDGRMLLGPLEPELVDEEYSYQKLINNQYPKGFVMDLRVPVHGNRIPLVYRKFRPTQNRFSNKNAWVEMSNVGAEFSDEEVKKILLFSSGLGMDFGELDVLRDHDDGRIYVVDANSTPYGPPNGLSSRDRRLALHLLKASYMKLIEAASINATDSGNNS